MCFGCFDGFVNNVGVNDSIGFDVGCDVFVVLFECNLIYYYVMVYYCVLYLKVVCGVIVNILLKMVVIG